MPLLCRCRVLKVSLTDFIHVNCTIVCCCLCLFLFGDVLHRLHPQLVSLFSDIELATMLWLLRSRLVTGCYQSSQSFFSKSSLSCGCLSQFSRISLARGVIGCSLICVLVGEIRKMFGDVSGFVSFFRKAGLVNSPKELRRHPGFCWCKEEL